MEISNINSRKLQVFVSHENLELSAEKTIQTTNWSLLAKHRKFSILATRCRVNSNFLSLCKATVGIMVISSELFVGFRSLKV